MNRNDRRIFLYAVYDKNFTVNHVIFMNAESNKKLYIPYRYCTVSRCIKPSPLVLIRLYLKNRRYFIFGVNDVNFGVNDINVNDIPKIG